MDEEIQEYVTKSSMSFAIACFISLLLVTANAPIGVFQIICWVYLMFIAPTLFGYAIFWALNAVILALTDPQETMNFLGKPHRGESHYAGPKEEK